jgi:site-specific DNA recombinase
MTSRQTKMTKVGNGNPGQPKRVLGVVRLSHMTDQTLSPEVQREKITLTSKARGDVLVHIAEDLDVSGAVSAWNRDLAPWLEDPERIPMWDAIVVAKLDRLSRSLLDFQKLLEWCSDNGKTIISISEGFDLSTPMGKMTANMLMMFAEFERERMGERRSERAQADKARGWFGGGRAKYGFKPVKVGDHFELEVDDFEKAVAERMAANLLAGKSATQIARDLTAEGIPTKLGDVKKGSKAGQPREWAGSTILKILSDPNGTLDTETWARVQPVIKDASRPKGNRYDALMLAGVAECALCGTQMWGQNTKRGDTIWTYYRCYVHGCKARMIRAEDLDAAADDMILSGWGDLDETVKTLVSVNDNQRLLDDIDRQLDDLNAKRQARAITVSEFQVMQSTLLAEQVRIEALPIERDRYEDVRTGRTIGEMWLGLDANGKRAWLLKRGIRVVAGAGAKRGSEPMVVIQGGEVDEDARALGAEGPEDIARDAYALADAIRQTTPRR